MALCIRISFSYYVQYFWYSPMKKSPLLKRKRSTSVQIQSYESVKKRKTSFDNQEQVPLDDGVVPGVLSFNMEAVYSMPIATEYWTVVNEHFQKLAFIEVCFYISGNVPIHRHSFLLRVFFFVWIMFVINCCATLIWACFNRPQIGKIQAYATATSCSRFYLFGCIQIEIKACIMIYLQSIHHVDHFDLDYQINCYTIFFLQCHIIK